MKYPKLEFPPTCWVWPFDRFRDLLSQTTDAPPEFKYFSLLSFLGLLCGHNFYIDYAYQQYLNFYCCVVGDTGRGKTSVLRALSKLFDAMLARGMVTDIVFLSNATTSEYLYERLSVVQGSPRVLIINDEFKRMLVSGNRPGTKNFFSDLNQLYDVHKDWSPGTKSQAKPISRPMISLITAIASEDLSKNLDEGFITGGTLNRILFIEGTNGGPVIKRPKSPDQVLVDELAIEIIGRLQRFDFSKPNLIIMSPEAEERWDDKFDTWIIWQSSMSQIQKDLTKRTDAYAYKLAALYSVLQGRTEIGPLEVEMGFDLAMYAARECLEVFKTLSFSERVRQDKVVINFISEEPGISRRDLFRKVDHILDSRQFADIIQNAIKNGIIVEKEEKTLGRSKKILYLADND